MESDGERKNVCSSVCKEDKVTPVTFKWKWGEDELPIAGQYTYLDVEIQNTAIGMHTEQR